MYWERDSFLWMGIMSRVVSLLQNIKPIQPCKSNSLAPIWRCWSTYNNNRNKQTIQKLGAVFSKPAAGATRLGNSKQHWKSDGGTKGIEKQKLCRKATEALSLRGEKLLRKRMIRIRFELPLCAVNLLDVSWYYWSIYLFCIIVYRLCLSEQYCGTFRLQTILVIGSSPSVSI